MKKEEILKKVRECDGTVISFPERGPWGNSSYRGNCSGYVYAWLMDVYHVNYLAEMYAGGGTGYDVCKDMSVKYAGADLNPNPVRPGIHVCNALTDEIPEEFSEADFIFQHMPYPEIGIKYAGGMYPDNSGKLKTQDIGQMPFDMGMMANNKVTMKLYSAMHPGAKMAILCGNVRRKGKYNDMMLNLALPGEVIQNIIKMQHNCYTTEGKQYARKNFVPIVHENLVVLKKPEEQTLYIGYTLPKKYNLDIRDSITATWKDVVMAVMYNLGGKVHYKTIVTMVEGHKKAENNNNVDAKIRQVLRAYNIFNPCGNGYYSVA